METGESPFLTWNADTDLTRRKGKMVNPARTSGKILQFAAPQPSHEGELEAWFRGVMRSNHDLVFALEKLRDSYQELMLKRPTESDDAVLKTVEVTLRNARNARAL